ncbi:protocadherin beta-14-like [Tubulanus polymorphus]|uniref:protocadherin beta-14-like n=1 Tax=Tubulanus polymorphus TaxID=672921 RepID=UPI003DA22C40
MIFIPGGATSRSVHQDDVRSTREYTTSVNEDLPIGSTILRSRMRGDFSYRINSNASEQVKQTFSVDSDSGDVVLIKPLDYERQKSYTIPVDATRSENSTTQIQRLNDNKVKTILVEVNVHDVNDNAPVITTNTLTPNGLIEVAENAPVGTFIAQLLVTDADSGKNGQFDCSLDAESFDLIRMNRNAYTLITRMRLDREMRSVYLVTLVCRDRGDPYLTSQETLKIRVLDVNDNMPRFSRPLYPIAIYENRLYNYPLLHVQAVDADSGPNGRVSYRILDDSGLISINARTEAISIHSRLDREVKSTYRFKVLATDSGEPRRTSTATIRIAVIDVNDNSPVFMNNHYEFSIRSDVMINTTVGQVQASDRDRGPNSEITYSLLYTGDKITRLFAVSKLGAITTRSRLDLEEPKDEYMLSIIARDNGREPRMSSASVRIRIIHSPRHNAETDKPAVP